MILSNMKSKLIYLRGPPAVGKSSIARKLAKKLKNAALLNEDWFKFIQAKRSLKDPITNEIADKLLFSTIKQMNTLDNYDYFIIEGLLVLPETIKRHKAFIKENKAKAYFFEVAANTNTLIKRNKVRTEHIKKCKVKNIRDLNRKIKSIPIRGATKLNTEQLSKDACVKLIIKQISQDN